jgi:hypothetical protein
MFGHLTGFLQDPDHWVIGPEHLDALHELDGPARPASVVELETWRLPTAGELSGRCWAAPASLCERAPKMPRDRHEKYRGERGQPSIAAPSRGDGTWARIR